MQTKTEMNHATVGSFKNHLDAESAVKELQKAGFKMNQLSVVGKDYHTEENVVGFYNTGDRVKYWGKLGAFWGGLWGVLFGSAFLMVPGVGPLVMAGPLVATIVGALEGATVMGGLNALGAALFSIGIPKNSILLYETAITAGQYLVIAHGGPEQAEAARGILRSHNVSDNVETFGQKRAAS